MVRVKVEQGWLEGERVQLVTGDGHYCSFKGVPYAAPPVGKLRFKAPEPPEPWEGIRKATDHGSVCYQRDIFTREIIPGSEDCLYLNVYSPELKPKLPLAVMVFIHGGGFESGSGNTDLYGPDFLVQQDVVVVTINYRLEVLGFLCLDTKDVPGNAGMKDQVAALRWVQRNIAQFGGDPNNVTVFGESAGGASTSMHIVSPMSKGVFKRAIPMSGVSICDWSLAFEPRRRAFAFGKLLGKDTEDPDELLEFLQSVPVEQLIDTATFLLSFEKTTYSLIKMYCFVPVVEKDLGQEQFLNQHTMTSLRNKSINDVDIMIGYTSSELLILLNDFESRALEAFRTYNECFVPRKILYECTQSTILDIIDSIRKHYFGDKCIDVNAMKEFVDYCNDSALVYPINKFAEVLAENTKHRVYFYKFSCESERNIHGVGAAKFGLSGAAHMEDLMYLFDAKKFGLTVDKNSPSYKMIQQTCRLFTNFAKFGNPTPEAIGGVTWPQYDNENKSYMDIGARLAPGSAPDTDVVKFWNKVYESAGIYL